MSNESTDAPLIVGGNEQVELPDTKDDGIIRLESEHPPTPSNIEPSSSEPTFEDAPEVGLSFSGSVQEARQFTNPLLDEEINGQNIADGLNLFPNEINLVSTDLGYLTPMGLLSSNNLGGIGAIPLSSLEQYERTTEVNMGFVSSPQNDGQISWNFDSYSITQAGYNPFTQEYADAVSQYLTTGHMPNQSETDIAFNFDLNYAYASPFEGGPETSFVFRIQEGNEGLVAGQTGVSEDGYQIGITDSRDLLGGRLNLTAGRNTVGALDSSRRLG